MDHGGTVNPPRNRKGGDGNPPPTVRPRLSDGKGCEGPARSETPHMRARTLHGNWEVPCLPTADGGVGRKGKSKDTYPR